MGPAPPIIGRLAERVLLEEQLTATRAGRGQVVIVGGEAGIGKTTMARNLAAYARNTGCQVLLGQSYDLMATPPYGPWLDLVERYQHQGSETGPVPVPAVFDGGNIDGISSQSEVFGQVREFLQALSADAPILLVLEDAHWADPASLELLRYIASRIGSIPLLVLVTYRIDELTRRNPFFNLLPTLIRESDGFRLDLKPWTRQDLWDFLAARYDLPGQDTDRLVGYLDVHAEGNPFFVTELLRALEGESDAGLARHDGGWRLAQIDRLVLPALVRQVIEARVARMGDITRDALAVAAVIGQVVPLDLWSHVAGIDESTILDIVDHAMESHLVAAAPDGTHVHFVHALTREALYQGIAPPRRRLIHRAVATALQDSGLADPDAVAYHLRQAGDPAAPDWLIRAGERAQRAYAWLSARDRFMDAAGLLVDAPDQALTRARLLYRCGRLQRYSHAALGIENLELAERLAEQAGDKVLMADAIYSQSLLRCFADEWAVGVPQMASAIDVLEALSPEEGRASWSTVNWMADALPLIELPTLSDIDPAAETLIAAGINHRRGGLPWFMAVAGHLGAARDMATAFLGHAAGIEAGPLVLSSTAHSSFGLGIAQSALGHPVEARGAMSQAREIYERLDHHAVIAFTYLTELNDVVIPWFTTDLVERRRVAAEAEQALERAGGALPSGLPARRAHLPLMYLEGAWNEAGTLASDDIEHGTYVLRRQVTRVLAPIACHRGQCDEAWRHIRSLLTEGSQTAPGTAVLLDALLLQELAIELCIDEGDLDNAWSWLEAHERWLEWSGARLGRADHELARARLLLATGEVPAAESAARLAIDLAADPYQPIATLRGRRLLGELMLDQGKLEDAGNELSISADIAAACNAPYERALSEFGLARARWHASPDAALALARGARSVCADLGAEPVLRRIDAFLQDDGPAVADASLPAGLTHRELDVLRLVAEGLTDAEIGTLLFISPRTVSQHLRSTYGKLGVHSRAAATRFAIERQIV
jgi:DNA-binding CsgD family transcriptional regulator